MRMSSMPWQPMQPRGERRASASAPATKMSMQTTQRAAYAAPATRSSYATTRLGSVAPPPPGPMNWGLALGWVTVVAAAVGIFYGVTSDTPWSVPRVRRNNRRRSSRLRANNRRSRRRVRRNGKPTVRWMSEFLKDWNAERVNSLEGTKEEVYDFVVAHMQTHGSTRVGDVTGYLGDWALPLLQRLHKLTWITIHPGGILSLGRPQGWPKLGVIKNRRRRRVSRNAPEVETRRRNVAPRMWDIGSDPDVISRIAGVEGHSDAMHAMRQYPGIGVTELLRVLWKSGEYAPETSNTTIHTFGSKSLQDAWKRGYNEGARNAHADPVSRAWSKARGPVRKSRIKRNYHGTAAEAAMRRLDAPRSRTGKVRTSRGVLKITAQRGRDGRPGGIRISRNAKRGTKRKVSAVMKAAAGLSVVRDLGISGAPAASKLGQRRYNLLVRRGAGLYRISAGRTPSVIKFKTASPQGAITNTRIASSRSGEAHWLVKVYGEGRPRAVVIRHIGGDGKTRFRVEEYAAMAYAKAAGYRYGT